MKYIQQSEASALRHMVQGYEWAAIGKGKVIDVSVANSVHSVFDILRFRLAGPREQ